MLENLVLAVRNVGDVAPRWARVALALGVAFVAACGSSMPADIDDEPSSSDEATPDDVASDNGKDTSDPDNGNFDSPDASSATPDDSDCQKVDILFVIDDSGSMGPKQENLAKNFPKFVDVIEGFRTKSGAKLDWRVAVTTSSADGDPADVEDGESFGGVFRKASSCNVTERWVEGLDPAVSTKFSCLAKVGTGGSPFEEPLRALKLSLNERIADGTNAGFRRDDALLAVVAMTDEVDNDDSDDAAIDASYEMLNTAAHGPGRWAFAAIAADQCPGTWPLGPQTSIALKKLVAKAGDAGRFSTICPADGDLTPALKDALGTFDAVCKTFKPPVN